MRAPFPHTPPIDVGDRRLVLAVPLPDPPASFWSPIALHSPLPFSTVGPIHISSKKLRATAKAVGLTLEKQGKGWQLVDAVTGTLVAADWTEDAAGHTLDQIETALATD